MRFLFALLSLLFAVPVFAQESAETVVIPSSDGLEIQADYYASESGKAVLLLHMLNGRRRDWASLIPYLTEQGYAVLAVDLRGHGDTGGRQDWALAEEDVQVAVAWLREQGSDQVAIIGASIGSNLALRGMANDENVVTAIALSPGLDYRGVTTDDAIETIDRRPVLFVAERLDSYSSTSVIELFNNAKGKVQVHLGTGSAHGTAMLGDEMLEELITLWLVENFE